MVLTLLSLNCLIFDFELSSLMLSRISLTSVFGDMDLLFLGLLLLEAWLPLMIGSEHRESADDSEDKPLLRL